MALLVTLSAFFIALPQFGSFHRAAFSVIDRLRFSGQNQKPYCGGRGRLYNPEPVMGQRVLEIALAVIVSIVGGIFLVFAIFLIGHH